MDIYKTNSTAETMELGKQLGQRLTAGDVVCLSGTLGAGKTILAKGIAEGAGITEPVTSPTFTILNVYEANACLVYHFDLYRLEHPAELIDIGFDEYVAGDGIAIIEWPNKFPDQLPPEHLWIEIVPGENMNERVFRFTPQNSHYRDLCEELKNIADTSFRYSHPCV